MRLFPDIITAGEKQAAETGKREEIHAKGNDRGR